MSNDKRVTYAAVLRAQAAAFEEWSRFYAESDRLRSAEFYAKRAADYRRMADLDEAAEQESAA